jgi:hypothetical protein
MYKPKEMFYEDRDDLQLQLITEIERVLKIRMSGEQEDNLFEAMDKILEPYTNGAYRNYN